MINDPKYIKGQIVYVAYPTNRDLMAEFTIDDIRINGHWHGSKWDYDIIYSGHFTNTALKYPTRSEEERRLFDNPKNPDRVIRWCENMGKYTINDKDYQIK